MILKTKTGNPITIAALIALLSAGIAALAGEAKADIGSCIRWAPGLNTQTCPYMTLWVDCSRYSVIPWTADWKVAVYTESYFAPFSHHLMISAQVDCGSGPSLLDFAIEQTRPREVVPYPYTAR